MDHSAPTRFGRYELLEPIGSGGMGEVWKARAEGPHGFEKVVALKRIHPKWAADAIAVERFVREARIAARLRHGAIVQVFEFGREGDELYIVMEHVDGASLEDLLDVRPKGARALPPGQALAIAAELGRALEHAHGLEDEAGRPVGVLHRDVSPPNVLLDRTGAVKLADFGVAAWAAPGPASLVAGKPCYMAPELLRGEAIDARVDLFSLGVLLYELLTGARPWPDFVDSMRGATLAGMGYEPPSSRRPSLPAELDALVGGLLALDPGERTPTAEAFLRALVGTSQRCGLVLDPFALRPLGEEAARARADRLRPSALRPSAPPHEPHGDETSLPEASSPGRRALPAGDLDLPHEERRTAPPRRARGRLSPLALVLLLGLLAAAIGGGLAFWLTAGQ